MTTATATKKLTLTDIEGVLIEAAKRQEGLRFGVDRVGGVYMTQIRWTTIKLNEDESLIVTKRGNDTAILYESRELRPGNKEAEKKFMEWCEFAHLNQTDGSGHAYGQPVLCFDQI